MEFGSAWVEAPCISFQERMKPSLPSLLFAGGGGSRHAVAFNDGTLCHVSGSFLRLTTAEGLVKIFALKSGPEASSLEASERREGVGFAEADGDAFQLLAAHEGLRLAAAGTSDPECCVALFELPSFKDEKNGGASTPSLRWRRRVSAGVSAPELLAIAFSHCGLRLFCLTRGIRTESPTDSEGSAEGPLAEETSLTYFLTEFDSGSGAERSSQEVVWNDAGSPGTFFLQKNILYLPTAVSLSICLSVAMAVALQIVPQTAFKFRRAALWRSSLSETLFFCSVQPRKRAAFRFGDSDKPKFSSQLPWNSATARFALALQQTSQTAGPIAALRLLRCV